MKIGIISSYYEKCGVSSYSENLVEYLLQNNIDVKVCGNYPKDQLKPDEAYVKRCFDVPFMTNETKADIPAILDFFSDRDVVHVQFETNLYHPSWFPELVKKLKSLNKKMVFTMHSSGSWPNLDLGCIDWFISHSEMFLNYYKNSSLIPMGVKYYPDVVPSNGVKSIVSFGLGRNNDDKVKASINESIKFSTTYGHISWKPLDELVKTIQESWVISLLYPPVGAQVSSSAIMTAIGCRRPVLVTNTNWFSHVINYPGVYPCDSDQDIKDNIKYLTNEDNLEDIKRDLQCLEIALDNDGRSFTSFGNKHINLYKNLCSNLNKS